MCIPILDTASTLKTDTAGTCMDSAWPQYDVMIEADLCGLGSVDQRILLLFKNVCHSHWVCATVTVSVSKWSANNIDLSLFTKINCIL